MHTHWRLESFLCRLRPSLVVCMQSLMLQCKDTPTSQANNFRHSPARSPRKFENDISYSLAQSIIAWVPITYSSVVFTSFYGSKVLPPKAVLIGATGSLLVTSKSHAPPQAWQRTFAIFMQSASYSRWDSLKFHSKLTGQVAPLAVHS